MSKFLSRKLLVVIIASVCDILIASGQMTPELKQLIIQLITGLAGLFVLLEGIISSIKATKGN